MLSNHAKCLTIISIPLFWILDALFDVYLFNNGLAFFDSLFTSDPNELWMRFSVVVVLVLFFLYVTKAEKIIENKDEISNEMEFLETIDPITLLINKRKLYELLEYEMEKDKRYKSGLSIIFCSIDNFKNIDETYRHSIVNNLLRDIALQLVKILRTSDVISRWSENEFLILIPNKAAEETKIVAKKIRISIEQHDFSDVDKVTASIGITQYADDDNKVTIVNRAEKALNKAQENGMNCIESIV